MKVNREQGYTLLELLFVLFIIGVVIVITTSSFFPSYKQRHIDQFFEMFQTDILFAQAYAMSNDKQIFVLIDEERSKYLLKEDGIGKVILSRDFSSKIKLKHMTLPSPFSFRSNGNIVQGGKLHVYYGTNTYSITFLLGRGRFYVNKL